MIAAKLRKVGGSTMLAVPPGILDQLGIESGAELGLEVIEGRLVLDPHPRPRYDLESLLSESAAPAKGSRAGRKWLEGPPVGRELL